MYGKTPTNAMVINVYSLDNVLVNSFSSQVAAAKWLNTSTVQEGNIVMFVLAWYLKVYTILNLLFFLNFPSHTPTV